MGVAFTESYNKKVLETLGITYSFVQDNVSYSAEAERFGDYTFKKSESTNETYSSYARSNL